MAAAPSLPLTALGGAVTLLYFVGVRRYNATHVLRPFPRWRIAAFVSGALILWTSLAPPLDAYADRRFAIHMVQHLLLMIVAAPLLILGTPLSVARHAAPASWQRPLGRTLRHPAVQMLQFPVLTWGAFPAVMWGSHYSALFEAALERPLVHMLEHALYLGAALLFWMPVVAAEPSRWRLSHPLRLLYLMVAGPPNVFLAVSLYQSTRLLYPHYEVANLLAGRSPLADQRAGAAVMWILGGIPFLIAMIAVAAAWARHETLLARRLDAALERRETGAV
ncbi:MAG TPA: cytochrome c oxidase assembly protein [bacterium]|nr:cytochrome c oxidase assembly protein [bacterium]